MQGRFVEVCVEKLCELCLETKWIFLFVISFVVIKCKCWVELLDLTIGIIREAILQ